MVFMAASPHSLRIQTVWFNVKLDLALLSLLIIQLLTYWRKTQQDKLHQRFLSHRNSDNLTCTTTRSSVITRNYLHEDNDITCTTVRASKYAGTQTKSDIDWMQQLSDNRSASADAISMELLAFSVLRASRAMR